MDRISNYNWTVTYTAQELTELLQSKGYGNSTIVDFRVTKTSPTGNAIEITFTDANGRAGARRGRRAAPSWGCVPSTTPYRAAAAGATRSMAPVPSVH